MKNLFKYRFLRYPGLLLLAWVMIGYGGTKPQPPSHTWRFDFSAPLRDNGSTCSGDEIHAKWKVSDEARFYIFKWSYRDRTLKDATGAPIVDAWHPLPDSVCNLLEARATVPNAENMEVCCWAVLPVGPQVVTNGVYHLNGVYKSMDDTKGKYVAPGVPIRNETRRLNPLPTMPFVIPSELINQLNENIKENTETEEEK